jgi:hypothetical protein
MSWVACDCEVCFCTAMTRSEGSDSDFSGNELLVCEACEMGEHEADDDIDPEA